MKKKYIYISLLLFIAEFTFFSCTIDDAIDEKEKPVTPVGTEYFSVGINPESAIQITRATDIGIEDEWNIKNMRFILYDGGLTGNALLIHDYNISFNNPTWTVSPVNGAPANLRIEGPLTAPRITKDFEKLIKQDYRLLVLVNHNSASNANLNIIVHDGQTLNSLMGGINHSTSILSTPIDLSLAGGSKGKNVFNYGIGLGLTGLSIDYPFYSSTFNSAAFFMSNADGLVFINKNTDLYSSLSTAQIETNRTVVNVERAVAKVGVLKGPDSNIQRLIDGLYLLTNGSGLVSSLTWTTDIVNYYWYMVRKQTNVAPSQGGGLETSTTNRQYYYAEDPNYSGISELKTGQTHSGASKPSYHFFRVKTADEIQRIWIDEPNTSYEHNKHKYEYISENTMAADEQYEDVATRVLIRANFVPFKTINGYQIGIGESYYYYKGYAFSHSQICYYLAYPNAILSLPSELHELVYVLFDQEVIEEFGFADGEEMTPITRNLVDPDNPPKEPTRSITKKGLTYYLHGISYYYIVIRHFSDTESPQESGYGRFGVVRNNVYNVTVEDITGPGYIDIPEPTGGILKSRGVSYSEPDGSNSIRSTIEYKKW